MSPSITGYNHFIAVLIFALGDKGDLNSAAILPGCAELGGSSLLKKTFTLLRQIGLKIP